MTPGNDQRTIVTFAIIALLILGMAVRQLHQPRHRPRQPARPRSGAAQGARRQPQAADHPVPRRIDPGRRRSRCCSRWRWSSCCCRRFAAFLDADLELHYFGARRHPAAGPRSGRCSSARPAASIRLSILSRFQPAQVLKANKSAAETPGSGRLRNALVVGQFAVSIGLIICTAVVYAPDRLRPHRRSRLSSATTSSRSRS